jgi:hypothetical protein
MGCVEYYQMDPKKAPAHFMRGTATEVWGKTNTKPCEDQLRFGTVMRDFSLLGSLFFSFLFF